MRARVNHSKTVLNCSCDDMINFRTIYLILPDIMYVDIWYTNSSSIELLVFNRDDSDIYIKSVLFSLSQKKCET